MFTLSRLFGFVIFYLPLLSGCLLLSYIQLIIQIRLFEFDPLILVVIDFKVLVFNHFVFVFRDSTLVADDVFAASDFIRFSKHLLVFRLANGACFFLVWDCFVLT